MRCTFALAVVVIALAVVPGSAIAAPPRCGFPGEGRTICLTYLTKAVPAQIEFYRSGRSSDVGLRTRAIHQMQRYFFGQSRHYLESLIGQWPAGDYQVAFSTCLSANLRLQSGGRTALLGPTESLLVINAEAEPVLSEMNRPRAITMRQLGSGRWVVVQIAAASRSCS